MSSQRHNLLIAILLCCAAISSQAANASGPPALPALSHAQYDAIIQRAQGDLKSELDDETPGTDATATLRPIATCAVTLDDGTIVVAHNEWVIANIADAETEADTDKRLDKLDRAVVCLTQLQAQVDSKGPAESDQADAVTSARKVLSSDVYGSDPVQPPSGIEKSFNDFIKWLNKKMDVKGPDVHLPSISVPKQVWTGLLIALGVFAIGMIGWLIASLIMNRAALPRRPRTESLLAMTDEEAELVASRSFDKLLDLANQRAAAGDFRAGFRLVYLSTLVSLDSAGMVRLNRSRTNWEYLRDLRNGPHSELAEVLRPLTIDFDRIWYGFATVGRTEFDNAVGHYENIKAAIRAAAAPVAASPFAPPTLGAAKH